MKVLQSWRGAFALVVFLSGQSVAGAETPLPEQALKMVDDQLPFFCPTISQNRSTEAYELSGAAKARLNSTFSKLADLGVAGAAKYKSEKSIGVAENDLALAIRNGDDCRLAVLNFFKPIIFPPQRASAHQRQRTTSPAPQTLASAPLLDYPRAALSSEPQATLSSSAPPQKMGPGAIVGMVNAAADTAKRLATLDGGGGIFVTASDDNHDIARDLYTIFNLGETQARPTYGPGGKVLIEPPVFLILSPDVDFPKPARSTAPGLVIHGGGAVGQLMRNYLSQCFLVKVGSRSNDEVDAYFKRQMIWLEVGPGSPWRRSRVGEKFACDE